MKLPKGFRKKYFTFSSILAHSVQYTIQNLIIKAEHTLLNKNERECENYDESDPPQETLLSYLQQIASKPCHCDCFYKLKTKLSVALFKFIPRCPYYTTYFAFRRTGVHPPFYPKNIVL